ncbi:hypothetical protein ACLOJK_034876 [Asimina triloba]
MDFDHPRQRSPSNSKGIDHDRRRPKIQIWGWTLMRDGARKGNLEEPIDDVHPAAPAAGDDQHLSAHDRPSHPPPAPRAAEPDSSNVSSQPPLLLRSRRGRTHQHRPSSAADGGRRPRTGVRPHYSASGQAA